MCSYQTDNLLSIFARSNKTFRMLFIWIAVILMGILAIADLVVGLTNDAVNFLNAAIGSNAAKRRLIYWTAALGILIGALLSVGMMEVARKGIINPASFDFTGLITVFLAVMITDIFLIDGFNTFGFPTSTTLAIVFELLGGGMALSLIRKRQTDLNVIQSQDLINTEKAFDILAGIVLSIFISFIVGMIIQFIARLVFSFQYQKKFKILFSFLGGLAVTIIAFMIAKKVLAGASFVDSSWLDLLKVYLPEVLIGVLSLSTFVFLFMSLSFNTDIPKIVVLFGTFALAMSFAANDLVNFIGLPLASILSFKQFLSSGANDPITYPLTFLNDSFIQSKEITHIGYLSLSIGAAVVMIITLFFSKKARAVTETEIYLGKQNAGYERFQPSNLSRAIVRNFLTLHSTLVSILPKSLVGFLNKRYKKAYIVNTSNGEKAYFDTIRASVNLVVASILISIGTYMRIPLSTTFVVFMVAMGTSLADQAWGRESAVYRIAGVLSVIGGWFFTAFIAFLGAFLIVFILYFGSWIAAIALTALLGIYLLLNQKYFTKKQEETKALIQEYREDNDTNKDHFLDKGEDQIRSQLLEASKIYLMTIQGFIDENPKQLREATVKAEFLDKLTRSSKSKLFYSFGRISEEGVEAGQYFIQAFDYLSEIVTCMVKISQPLFEHIENNHRGMKQDQKEELQELLDEVAGFFNHLIHLEKEKRFEPISELISKQSFLIEFQEDIRRKQIKRVQRGEGRTRVSILYMEVLAETKNILLYSINLLKAHRDFKNAMHKK